LDIQQEAVSLSRCCGKRFFESNCLISKRRRITDRLAAQCVGILEMKQSQREIAMQLGVSESTVADGFL
jgi:Trp operon repressor